MAPPNEDDALPPEIDESLPSSSWIDPYYGNGSGGPSPTSSVPGHPNPGQPGPEVGDGSPGSVVSFPQEDLWAYLDQGQLENPNPAPGGDPNAPGGGLPLLPEGPHLVLLPDEAREWEIRTRYECHSP